MDFIHSIISKRLLLVALFISCVACDSAHDASSPSPFGEPPERPQLFLPDVLGSSYNTRDMAIASDGREIYYTIVSPRNTLSAILTVKWKGMQWSKPEVVPFSGQYSDLEPALSPDGTKLFFASNRPDSAGGEPADFDIWMVHRTASGWSTPENLGDSINTANDEFYPSVATSGNLYFTATLPDTRGREDICLSLFVNGVYMKAHPLGESINTGTWEYNAFVNPSEDLIIFGSFQRDDERGGGDLYWSKKEDGLWSKAHLMDVVNSPYLDYAPFLTADETIFFFTSDSSDIRNHYVEPLKYDSLMELLGSMRNGTQNIYWLKASVILK